MALNKSQKSHQSGNRGSWTHFHPPPLKYRRGHLLNQRAIIFKLERTSYISHEQKPNPTEKLWRRIKI